MTQREVTKNLKEFTKYMDRFENYVGVALNEPQYTYDREFNADLEKRYKARDYRSGKIRLNFEANNKQINISAEKDTRSQLHASQKWVVGDS